MIFGGLINNQTQSPVEGLSLVRPKVASKSMKSILAPLMLTSLVDAFAVIVIYLLVSTSQATTEVEIFDDIKLPTASKSNMIEPAVNVRVVGNEYFIGSESVSPSDLLAKLQGMDKDFESQSDVRRGKLVVQADTDANFEAINPLISIAAQSGFDQIKFATLEGRK